MKLHLLTLLSILTTPSLQNPVPPQITTAVTSSISLPISSSTSTLASRTIKLYGRQDTQGQSMASAFSSYLSAAIAEPESWFMSQVDGAIIIGGLVFILGAFVALLIWGYKKRKENMEQDMYGDQDNGGYGGGGQGGVNMNYTGGQGQGYGGAQPPAYGSGPSRGPPQSRNNGGGGNGNGGEEKKVEDDEDEGEESGEGEEGED